MTRSTRGRTHTTYRTKRRVKPRFLIFLAALTAVIAAMAMLLNQPQATAVIRYDTLTQTRKTTAVIVRDEQVVNAEAYGKIVYYVAEGERVEMDTMVATILSNDYNPKTLQDLAELERQIEHYQQNNILKNILNQDLQTVESQIVQQTGDIAQSIQDMKVYDIVAKEQQLKETMRLKQEVLRQIVTADEGLTALYEQQQTLQESIDKWETKVLAPKAGMVSFFLDGCEALLNPAALESITYQDVKGILSSQLGKKQQTAQKSRPLFRMINNHQWYMILLWQGEGYIEGQTYDITMDGQEDAMIYHASVIRQAVDGNGGISILSVNQEIGEMVSQRSFEACVNKSVQGLMVPAAAVYAKNGKSYVDLVTGSKRQAIAVTVLLREAGQCIIASAQEDVPLNANLTVLLH